MADERIYVTIPITAAMDWIGKTPTGTIKTAISLPDLVRETNTFSKKYRAGCVPKLLDSNPHALFLNYQVKCNKADSDPHGHNVRVQFDVTKVQESQRANDLDIQCSCSCPAFLYFGAQWALHERDALLGAPRPKLQKPTERLDLRANYVLCIAPGTMIWMADGTEKPIEKVQVGDWVLTHRGRARQVTATLERPAKTGEYAYSVKAEGYRDPLVLSKDHPLAVIRGNEECACGCGIELKQIYVSNTPSGRARKPWSRCFHPGHGRRNKIIDNSTGRQYWKNPAELIQQELLYFPKIQWAGTKVVDPDFASLVGYYLAEGCVTQHVIRSMTACSPNTYVSLINGRSTAVYETHFALNSNERYTLAADIENKAKRLFGENTPITIRPAADNDGIRVEVRNSEFAATLVKLVGVGSSDKKLSDEVLSWNKDAMMELVSSYVLGDGGLGESRHTVSSISRNLIKQISMFLYSTGIWHGLSYDDRPEYGQRIYRLRWDYRKYPELLNKMRSRLRSHDLQKTNKTALTRNPNNHNWQDGFTRVCNSTTQVTAPAKFYDLTVDEDESFIANGIVVHNCKHLHAIFERILPSVQHNVTNILRERDVRKRKGKDGGNSVQAGRKAKGDEAQERVGENQENQEQKDTGETSKRTGRGGYVPSTA